MVFLFLLKQYAMKKNYLLLILLCFGFNLYSQNTVGTILNDADAYNGYTLLSPFTSNETYLINNCGEVVHQWTSTYTPGVSTYLLENGNLLKTGKIPNATFQFGGVGGKLELFDWDGNLIWEYTYSTNNYTQHHDIYPLPNGNILILASELIPFDEAIQAGRDTDLIDDGVVFNEKIIEIEPVGTNLANIVWEWNIKDHLVQDFDVTKDNYGVIADNPQLLDFNYVNTDHPVANWLHVNSIQYNETLDQIILSTRILSEVYIIDHSTTTIEAASHSGGLYGKGGDLLYRWGNPEAYDHGTSSDQTLFGQHYPHWIADGLTDAGKIMIFNNGGERGYSSVDLINPPQSTPGNYIYDATNGYAPTIAEWIYTTPVDTDFFSAIISSAQRLPNGNTLICDGDSGYFFEIDPSENIVWEYVNPDSSTGPINQGDTPSFNLVFRALKFPLDFPAFIGKDLTPTDPIETNPDLSDCNLLSVSENSMLESSISIYPNPSKSKVFVNSEKDITKIELYSISGQKLIENKKSNTININDLSIGIYLIKIYSTEGSITKRIIKE